MTDFTTRMARKPFNMRTLAQEYADQSSLFRRTLKAIEEPGRLPVDDVLNDPLHGDTGRYSVTQKHERIVDLLILAALGQHVDKDEITDHIGSLGTEYGKFGLFDKLRHSEATAKITDNKTFNELEQEWVQSTNDQVARQFAQIAKAAVQRAARECGVSLSPLPDF